MERPSARWRRVVWRRSAPRGRAESMAKDPGAKTIGRYQILEELGRGAMGIVYKGHDPVIGRTVALKTIAIQGDEGDAAEFRQRLFREASAAGNLTHPNIVTVYDVVEEGDVTAVAMEFIEGETLKDAINTRSPMHVELALDVHRWARVNRVLERLAFDELHRDGETLKDAINTRSPM